MDQVIRQLKLDRLNLSKTIINNMLRGFPHGLNRRPSVTKKVNLIAEFSPSLELGSV